MERNRSTIKYRTFQEVLKLTRIEFKNRNQFIEEIETLVFLNNT